MLYQLGTLQFSTAPVSITEYSRDTAADFAEKDVIGALKPMEAVGEGSDEFTFRCALFPHRFDGLFELETLHAMRLGQREQILVRGDGFSLGWRVVTKIHEEGTYLDVDGIGRCLKVELTLKKCPAPSGQGLLSALSTLARLLP